MRRLLTVVLVLAVLIPGAPSALAQSTSTAPSTVRINSGGGAYTDVSGNVWEAERGCVGGFNQTSAVPIAGTNDKVLYQSLRSGVTSCSYAVANGTYTVTLKFAELAKTGANQRKFDVMIEGQTVIAGLDVFAAAGGQARALDRSATVTVADGKLDLAFVKITDSPTIAAIEIVGSGGSVTPPAAPSLSGPADGVTTTSARPTLSWEASASATGYHVWVSTSADFGPTSVIDADEPSTSYTPTSDLAAGTYYWRVSASNAGGTTSSLSVWSFVVQPTSTPLAPTPGAPTLVGPGVVTGRSAPSIDTLAPSFSWSAVTGATGYRIQVSTGSTFSNLTINTTTSGSPYTLPSGQSLARATQYWWRVQSTSAPSTWSGAFTFKTPAVPVAPRLSSPSNLGTVGSLTPTLAWMNVSGATSYQVQVATDSKFVTKVIDTTVNGLSKYDVPGGLSASSTYYWRVSASNAAGTSAWSLVWSFKTANVDTTPPAVSVTTPSSNASTSSRALTASASDGTGSGVASVLFQLSADGGQTWTAVGTAILAAPYTTTLPTSLVDGPYQVRAQATDVAGNTATSAAVSFTLDTTPPALPVVTDPSGPTTVSAGSYTIKGTAEANSLVRAWVDSNGNGLKDPGEALAGSQQLSGGATSFSISVNLTSNAANAFVVTATDAAANESASAVVPKISQDSVGLSISGLTVNPAAFSPNGDGVKDTASIGYTLSTAATVTVRVYDGASPTPNLIRTLVNAQPRQSGANTETWDGKTDGGQVAADGSYTVKIDATNSLGTAALQLTITVVLDTTPPHTTITSQPPSSTTSTDASFTFSSSEPGSSLQCTLDSQTAADCSTGAVSYSTLAKGSHSFTVRATDPAGNVEITPPTATWISSPTPPRVLAALADYVGVNSVVDDNCSDIASVAGWVRDYHKWAWYETSDGVFNWSGPAWPNLDAMYGCLFGQGVKIMPVVEAFPQLTGADPNNTLLPDFAKHARYLAALVQHYGNQLAAIETWNEPDLPGSPFKGTPAGANTFAPMDTSDYNAVKGANSSLPFVLAGLKDPNTPYLDVVDQVSGGKFDVLNFHWYSVGDTTLGGGNPESGHGPEALNEMKAWRAAHSPAKPIWVTEVGWDTFATPDGRHSEFYAPEDNAANYLLRALALLQAWGADRTFLFQYRDNSKDPTSQYGMSARFNSSGLVTLDPSSQIDARKKTSWYYLAALKATLGNYALDGIVSDGPNVYDYEYVIPGTNQRAAMLWARSGMRDNGYTASYTGPAGTLVEPVKPVDPAGPTSISSQTTGQLTLTEKPVFVLYSGSAPQYKAPDVVPPPGPAGACGQLVNCSFENGLTGWSMRPGLEDYNRANWWPAHGGLRTYRMAGTNVFGPYIQQDVAAAPGEVKEFRVWVNVTEARPGMNVLIDLTPMTRWGGWLSPNNAPEWRYVVDTTTTGWVPVNATLTMPPSTGLVRLQVHAEPINGTVYLDDLYLGAPGMAAPVKKS